jgi:hypothetical protein
MRVPRWAIGEIIGIAFLGTVLMFAYVIAQHSSRPGGAGEQIEVRFDDGSATLVLDRIPQLEADVFATVTTDGTLIYWIPLAGGDSGYIYHDTGNKICRWLARRQHDGTFRLGGPPERPAVDRATDDLGALIWSPLHAGVDAGR